MELRDSIRTIKDFPKKGILFRDITTLFKDPAALHLLVDELVCSLKGEPVDVVVGPEARGFITGAPLAYALHAGFVPVRKEGKLPYETFRYSYALEYGTDTIEIHKDAIQPGMRVLVVDDLLATGGTALAACKLVEELGGIVVGVRFAIELEGMGGREKLMDYDVQSVITFPGD